MQQTQTDILLIDFDSTFIKSEGLIELAGISLRTHPEKNTILNEIKNLTDSAMEGTIPFDQSLQKRLQLIKANQTQVKMVGQRLKKHVTDSFIANKSFIKQNKNRIYILSGGFLEFIYPLTDSFGIAREHVFANTFTYDEKGYINGVDTKNPLSKPNGKAILVKSLQLQGKIIIIGDSQTDAVLKKEGLADEFIAFTENITRDSVVKHSDHTVKSFDEYLFLKKLPRAHSYPKNRIKVLLLENIDQAAYDIFSREGYEVIQSTNAYDEEELIKIIADISILCIRSRTTITKKVLQNAPHLLAIGIFSIGTNQVDLQTAALNGVAVFNAPYSNIRSVVELVMGEIIMLSRTVFDKSLRMHQGIWEKSAQGAHEIKGKTLGIIGYGNIGSQVGLAAESFGMNVIFYDKSDKPALGNAQSRALPEILKESDVITIHVDGDPKNTNLIGDREFKHMKDGVIFINASRGFVVDLDSLVTHIKRGKIKGCGIDVFLHEPRSNDEPFSSPLQQLSNVILTPHLGGSTVEAQASIARFVSNKVISYINTGNTQTSVNIPNIILPKQVHAHRLLHLHKNVPGVLMQINTALSTNHNNIVGQYLNTNQNVGYVITDIDNSYNEAIIKTLKLIPETIKLRVLY